MTCLEFPARYRAVPERVVSVSDGVTPCCSQFFVNFVVLRIVLIPQYKNRNFPIAYQISRQLFSQYFVKN